ncbi:MAG: DUF1127 domain-containing protein [Proteobacteria bacterium]|nr:DUF1127 domain-containing protein [Pseudomonadota bacterium]
MSLNEILSVAQLQSSAVRYSPAEMDRLARSYRAEVMAEGLAKLAVTVTAGLRQLAAAYRRWDERQQTIADLERLDDRCLADIGVAREEIVSFAAGHQARHDADEHLYVAGTVPTNAANTQGERRIKVVVAA